QMMLINPQYMIRSRADFYLSIIAMFILVLGFTLGPSYEIEPAMIAITVAAAFLIVSREWVDEILKRVNWGTIFFLIGLFGLVAALNHVGIIIALGDAIGAFIGGNEIVGIVFMTWVPALLSAVIDNIPISLVLAPIAGQFAALSPLLPIALIFAVNIGGFLLPIGSPANILAIALSEKEHRPISMLEFLKIGAPLALLMLSIIYRNWMASLRIIIHLERRRRPAPVLCRREDRTQRRLDTRY
ncbi:MAG: SLC13 family permease, partial [Candidatus Thorarchaeota archaeon]